MNAFDLRALIQESNKIEGIFTLPSAKEEDAYTTFLRLPAITVGDMCSFVTTVAPGSKLRMKPGRDVMVGGFLPMKGGPGVMYAFKYLLEDVNDKNITPHQAHLEYETLHPFTDCNGRSGRLLWYWMHMQLNHDDMFTRGFLHSFYYETLRNFHG